MNFPNGFILFDNGDLQISVFNPKHTQPSGIMCPRCNIRAQKAGMSRGKQRYHCDGCGRSFNSKTAKEAPLLVH